MGTRPKRSLPKSTWLKVPSGRADLSHTGMCGVILRSTSHLKFAGLPDTYPVGV